MTLLHILRAQRVQPAAPRTAWAHALAPPVRKDQPGVGDVHVETTMTGGAEERRACRGCGRNIGTAQVCPFCGTKVMKAAVVKAAHKGTMVALYPPAPVASGLALPDGTEAPEDMHLTLVYLAADDDDDPPDPDVIRDVVTNWARSTEPIDGVLGGTGLFNPSPTSDGLPVTVALVDAPSLPAARQQLVDRLGSAGVKPSLQHGFIPHITRTYGDVDDLDQPEGALRFGYASIVGPNGRLDIPLGNSGLPISVTPGSTEVVPVAKSIDDQRYTVSPVYIANRADYHGEWATPEELQKAIHQMVRDGDRQITLQHLPGVDVGEWVGLMCWPVEHEADLFVPGQPVRKVALPAYTPWMEVIWTPEAWPLVKGGHLKGLSMEGTARRTIADIPGLIPAA